MNIQGSAPAKIDLEQGLFIKYDEGDVTTCGAGDRPDGVTTDSTLEGQIASFVLIGNAPVQAGAALSGGDRVQSDANGRAIPLDGGAEAGIVRTLGLAPSGGDHAKAEIVFNSHPAPAE